jgi:hypothetical protein
MERPFHSNETKMYGLSFVGDGRNEEKWFWLRQAVE